MSMQSIDDVHVYYIYGVYEIHVCLSSPSNLRICRPIVGYGMCIESNLDDHGVA